MALVVTMRFPGMGPNGAEKYDAVMREMGLLSAADAWPDGLIGHVAGRAGDDWRVIDAWESKQHLDAFLQSRLMPAFHAVGGIPEPEVVAIDLHNTYLRSRDAQPV